MRTLTITRLLLILCLLSGTTIATHAQDNLRQTLFEEAKDALIVANKAQAPYLAPTRY